VTWLPSRLNGERDVPMWTALAIALILVVQPGRTGAVILSVLIVLTITLLASKGWRIGWIGIIVLLGVGIALRLGVFDHRASDVLDVTGDALRRAFLGFSPWGHGFSSSRPTGAPFPYGPIGLFWYTPAIDAPRELELFVSCTILALLAVRGRPLGLAVYATAPTLVLTATDGSNDTSAGLLIRISLVLAAKRPWLGAVALAVAIAFKPYAAAWAPALLVYGGWTAVAALTLTSLVVWAPSALNWGIFNYFRSLQMAEETHFSTYWSFGVIYEQVFARSAPREALNAMRLVLAATIGITTLWFIKSMDRVILSGLVVFAIVMFGGYWGSYAYLGAIAPIICWRLDDWLGIPAPSMIASAPWAPKPTGDTTTIEPATAT
jgi:hypothetical protein